MDIRNTFSSWLRGVLGTLGLIGLALLSLQVLAAPCIPVMESLRAGYGELGAGTFALSAFLAILGVVGAICRSLANRMRSYSHAVLALIACIAQSGIWRVHGLRVVGAMVVLSALPITVIVLIRMFRRPEDNNCAEPTR